MLIKIDKTLFLQLMTIFGAKLIAHQIRLKGFLLGLVALLLPSFLHSQTSFFDEAPSLALQHFFGTGVAGGGVSFYDFDQDGWDDLTLATEEGRPINFYRNVNGGFVPLPSLISNLDEVKQILWTDIDNDGDKDLFITTLRAANRLYENKGNLEMVDITAAAGLSMEILDTYGACLTDFDRDGWIDIFVTQRNIDFDTNRNFFYRNLGNNTFEEIAESLGLDDPQKAPFFPAVFDMNNDNWPDIYIAQDKSQGNTLLLHNGASLTYTDVSIAASANLIMNAMGIAVGDYNCDGWQDLYVSNTPHGNALLQNNQIGGFSELAEVTGTSFNGTAWGTHFFDADNDGFEDLYVSGMAVGANVPSSAFYYNDKAGSFAEGEAGFVGDTVSSFGNALGDYNNDGHLDILVINTKEFPAQLWKNEGHPGRNWLKIKLEGVLSNRDAIGARVDLYTDEHYQIRYQHGGMGYLGQNSASLHFGLGEMAQVDSMKVTWPTGHQDHFYDVQINQVLGIVEGSSTNGEIKVDDFLLSDLTETEERADWSFYPNPAKQNIHLTYEGTDNDQLLLYDSKGRQLATWPLLNGHQTISTQTLAPGLYFLQRITPHLQQTKRLLIVR